MVKEFSFNDGEFIRGMVLQGERHTYREPSFPEENKVLFTIPIRRKIVGKAVAILMGLGVLRYGHSIRVVQFDKDRLDGLGSDLLVAEAVNSGIEPDAVKELAAVIEMAANGNWIKDGDYFALYWSSDWSAMEGSDDDEEEEAEEAEEDDRDREIDFAELGQQYAAEREGYDDR